MGNRDRVERKWSGEDSTEIKARKLLSNHFKVFKNLPLYFY